LNKQTVRQAKSIISRWMMIISSKDTVNQQLAGGWDETTTGVAVKRFKRLVMLKCASMLERCK
jgi:hypothetical protein